MAICLVTGGNGFLGSYIVDELVAAGHEVRVLDRFSTGSARFRSSSVTRITGAFEDDAAVREALDGAEYVYHFLSTTTPVSSDRDPVYDLESNVRRTVEFLDRAARSGVKHVYFASTGGAIYGRSASSVISEDHPTEPISPYGIGKLAIEGFLRYFKATTGMGYTAFRISNPYGPRQSPSREQGVVPIFIRRATAGLPLIILGDGSAVRDYVFVEDAARMIVGASMLPTEHRIYNIGSGVGLSVADVVRIVKQVVPRDVSIEYRPAKLTAVDRVVLDVSRYSEEFGDQACVDAVEGFRRTVESLGDT
jgi:UDP-glucose 4-epimerase